MKTHYETLKDLVKDKKPQDFQKPTNLDQFKNSEIAMSYYNTLMRLVENSEKEEDLTKGNIGVVNYKYPTNKNTISITEGSNTWRMPDFKKITNTTNQVENILAGCLDNVESMLHGERLADMRARDRFIAELRKNGLLGLKEIRRSQSLAKEDYDRLYDKEKINYENKQYDENLKRIRQNPRNTTFIKPPFNKPTFSQLAPETQELYRVSAYNKPSYQEVFQNNPLFQDVTRISERPFCTSSLKNCTKHFGQKSTLFPAQNNHGHLVNTTNSIEEELDTKLKNYRMDKLSKLEPKEQQQQPQQFQQQLQQQKQFAHGGRVKNADIMDFIEANKKRRSQPRMPNLHHDAVKRGFTIASSDPKEIDRLLELTTNGTSKEFNDYLLSIGMTNAANKRPKNILDKLLEQLEPPKYPKPKNKSEKIADDLGDAMNFGW